MFLFCLVFPMSLCASVYMCFGVTCWERADLLALVCGVYYEFVTFPLVSWVRCGTWLYRFLIFAPLLTLTALFRELSDHPCVTSWQNQQMAGDTSEVSDQHVLMLSSIFAMHSVHIRVQANFMCIATTDQTWQMYMYRLIRVCGTHITFG